jgi:hypothetical protein
LSEGYEAPAEVSRVQRYCNLIPINVYGTVHRGLKKGKQGFLRLDSSPISHKLDYGLEVDLVGLPWKERLSTTQSKPFPA